MEAVILIGIPASGRSSFFRRRFFDTHVRINLDMLRTRRRERVLLGACLEAKQPFVIDNTNPTAADRARYIPAARAARFRIVGYHFPPDVEQCLRRNAARSPRVPEVAIRAAAAKLQPPRFEEGFDELYRVGLTAPDAFAVEPWSPDHSDEPRP